MMMAYLFIFFSALCSIAIAHLLKVTEVKKLRTLNTLTANYLAAFLLALVAGISQTEGNVQLPSRELIFFSLAVGAFFISNFLFYSKSVHANGMGITIAFMRLSLLVPVLVSILLYGEAPGWIKTTGVILVFGAMILLIPRRTKVKVGNINAAWLLLFIFILTGFADASLKVYKEEFSIQVNESLFMSMVFGSSFIFGFVLCLFRKGPIFTKEEARLGTIIGIPNLYSAIFLIWALGIIDGSIAYPFVNIVSVVGGTLLGLWFWKDRVTRKQWAGLAIALIAILILL